MGSTHRYIKLIITDFDGIILESEQAKSQAFYECFSIFPEYIDQIMAYHHDNMAVSRYDKFEYIYKEIVKKEYTKEERNWVARRFNDIVFQKVVESPPIPGVFEFLDTFSKLVPIYVVSSTPTEELIKVLEALDIVTYFQKVYGTPPEKAMILSKVLRETGIEPSETCFIGDTNEDLKAAQANQIPFIARRNIQIFVGPRVCEMDDFRSINEILRIDNDKIQLKPESF